VCEPIVGSAWERLGLRLRGGGGEYKEEEEEEFLWNLKRTRSDFTFTSRLERRTWWSSLLRESKPCSN
jgi:hypothetical protein